VRRALVTGATGLVGSHIVERLHAEQGVAVGGRGRGHLRAEIAGRAGAVVDHHLLSAERGGELRLDDARDGIGSAACRERHDPADRPVGVLRLGGRGGCERQHEHGEAATGLCCHHFLLGLRPIVRRRRRVAARMAGGYSL
jgi:hypothetical protein